MIILFLLTIITFIAIIAIFLLQHPVVGELQVIEKDGKDVYRFVFAAGGLNKAKQSKYIILHVNNIRKGNILFNEKEEIKDE